MNARIALSNIIPAIAVVLSGCCSMDDVFEPRSKAAHPTLKRPVAQTNSPTPKATDLRAHPSPTGATPASTDITAPPPLQKPAAPDRSRLNQLESEELAIRNDKSLSPAERNQQLQKVWKEQTDAGLEIPQKNTPPTEPRPASQPPLPTPSQPAHPKATAGTAPIPSSVSAAQKNDEPKHALRVPGKPGIIKSPYDGKLLDATGVPPGTEVKDPSTGKIMLVP